MDLQKFLELGSKVYTAFTDLAWAFTEVTLAEMFPEVYDIYSFFDFVDGGILGLSYAIWTPIWNMSLLEFCLCTSISVTLAGIVFAIVKWFVDIVL